MKNDYINNPGALKIDLMLRGVRVEDPVIKALACSSNGIDLVLPNKTLVSIPCFEDFIRDSPYRLEKRGENLAITEGEVEVPVSLMPRPAFYDRKTTTGVYFSRIVSVRGSISVITPSQRCDFFNKNVECGYCAGDFDKATPDARVFTVDEVLEAAGAVLKEKTSDVIYFSIGFSDGDDGGMAFLEPYIKAVKKHYNCLVAAEALPPRDSRWIDRAYAAGADAILFNVEIYDKELFEAICPGRASLVGRKRYLDALAYAAKVFPNGTVASHLIVGLEPPGSTCQGIDALTEMGVVPILPIYRPSPGKALRIEPLTAEVIIPVYKHLYKALREKKINCGWLRDISSVTTPAEGRFLFEGGKEAKPSVVENFYKTRLGMKAAWGLSTIRRKLRVKEGKE